VAAGGERYAELANAYRYREQLVPGCSCNGRTSYGLATIDAPNDPTLRQGDIVATRDGMKVVAGAPHHKDRTPDFAPIQNYVKLPTELRRKLATMRIGPPK
jgi:hypothetical protein